jgi:hypothetical protein
MSTSAEGQLLSALKAYELQIPVSVSNLQQSYTLDAVTNQIAQDVAPAALQAAGVPGGQSLVNALNSMSSAVQAKYGANSTAGLASKGAILGIFGMVASVLSGRTYETDNYWGAVFYCYFVAGQSNVTDYTKVADGDVLNALQWFEEKLGVFISGREHLLALQQSAEAYMNYYGVNSDTTMDPVKVALAVGVMQTYMPDATFGKTKPGAWAATVGVYDNAVTAALLAYMKLGGTVSASQESAALSSIGAPPGTVPISAVVPTAAAPATAATASSLLVPGLIVLGLFFGIVILWPSGNQ